jgi:NADH-quinone oxidoreductase subunit G
MLQGGLKAAVLLNVEPEHDTVFSGPAAVEGLSKAEMVVTLSPFKTNLAFSDVLLPIAPFTETSGTFVNAEGRAQSFHAVVKPLAETRPAWKVLRVLGNLLDLSGFDFEASPEVLQKAKLADARLSNATVVQVRSSQANEPAPVVASIYQLDGLVRRAPSLQMTADGRAAHEQEGALA